MSKQDTNSLRANASTANGMATTYGGNASQIQSILMPTATRLAAGNGGMTPTQLNNANTAALQATGGSTAGIVGGGLQRAAATNNAGGANAIALAAGHDATQNLTDAALGVQNQNTQIALGQQSQELNQLGQLYGTNVSAGENALGLSTQATTQANAAANNGFWHQVAGQALGNAMSLGTGKLGKFIGA